MLPRSNRTTLSSKLKGRREGESGKGEVCEARELRQESRASKAKWGISLWEGERRGAGRSK